MENGCTAAISTKPAAQNALPQHSGNGSLSNVHRFSFHTFSIRSDFQPKAPPQGQVQFYFACSHFWFATVQEVLHADWQEVWHSPQPPCAAVCFRVAEVRVDTCFMDFSLLLFRMTVPFLFPHIGTGETAERRGCQHAQQTDRHAYRIDRLGKQCNTCRQQDQKNQTAGSDRPQ